MNELKYALGLKLVQLKKKHSWTWAEIGQQIGQSAVWTCAACLGQMSMKPETASKAAALFSLTDEEKTILEQIPYRGSVPEFPPTDPLIYRIHEIVSVYGTTLKQLIEEEFGDGIMSAIDFDMFLERQPDPKGDRVKITMTGKFLPYKSY